MSTYRSPARLWWEWRLNVRFLSDWLALQLLPWWWIVGFYDTCTDLRRAIIEIKPGRRAEEPTEDATARQQEG